MRCDNVITIYNIARKPDGGSEFYPTVFSCHLEAGEGKNHNRTAERDTDVFSAFIPFTVQDEVNATYVPPEAYERLSFKDGYFTFNHGDIVLKGVHTEPVISEKEFIMKHPEAVRVQGCDTYDFGSASMRHWEVHCG